MGKFISSISISRDSPRRSVSRLWHYSLFFEQLPYSRALSLVPFR